MAKKSFLQLILGTSAKVGVQILGTSCATKPRILNGENCFQRNGLDIFRIALDRR